MPDDTTLKGFSQQAGPGEEKVLADVAKATDQHTAAMQRQTKAMRDNSQVWGRLNKEQQTFMQRSKTMFDKVRASSNDFAGAGRAVGGYTDKLKQGSTVTAYYNRQLDAMRKGQSTFASTMVATTNNISSAMDKSQKYVNAVHDSYRSAHKMAGEWRVETKALQQAVDDLNARFATQIAVSGDMTGAIEGMRKEALIMSKYLGTSMQDVMDSWQERLQQNIGSLDDARNEMIRVTYQADLYAQEIQKLGDAYLKTGNIGKREFVRMVRDVAKMFRTGTVQIDGYARALKGLLAETKKMGLTANEQRLAQEGLAKTTKAMFTMDSELSLYGMKAAQQVRAMWDDPKWLASQDEQVRRRLEMVKKRFADEPEIVQTRAIMDVMRGSAAGSAMGMRMMQQMGNLTINRELIATQTEGNLLTADAITQQIQSGQAAQAFDKKSTAETKKQRDEQTKSWMEGIEASVKAAHTAKDIQFQILAQIHKIHKTLEYWSKASLAGALTTQGASIGGQLLMNRLLGGGAAARGGGLLRGGGGLLAGGGGLGAGAGAGAGGAGAGTGAAAGGIGAAGAGAAITGSFLVGLAAGVGGSYVIDKQFGMMMEKTRVGRLLAGEKERERAKLTGEGMDLSTWITRGWRGKVIDETIEAFPGLKLSAFGLAKKFAGLGDYTEEEMSTAEARAAIGSKEYQTKRKLIKTLEKEIEDKEKREKELTFLEKKRLDEIRKQVKTLKEATKKTREQEIKIAKLKGGRIAALSERGVGRGLRRVEFGAGLTEEEKAGEFVRKHVRPGMKGVTGQTIMRQLAMLPEDVQAKFGDVRKFTAAAQDILRRRELVTKGGLAKEQVAAMTREQRLSEYKRLFPKGALTGPVTAYTGADAARLRETQKLMNIQLDLFKEGAGIAGLPSAVTTNAKGEIIFEMPGRKIVLRGLENAVVTEANKKTAKG